MKTPTAPLTANGHFNAPFQNLFGFSKAGVKQLIFNVRSKTNRSLLSVILIVSFIFGLIQENLGQSQTFTTPGTANFTVPAGVTSITVQVWGGGGRGGSTSGDAACGGGGGGAFSMSTLLVDPGNSFTVNVGEGSSSTSAGGDSWFGSTSTILAKGGNSVPTNSGSGASGGSAAIGVGSIKYNGGSGAIGTTSGTDHGGGGGSSAGTGANGNNSTSYLGAIAPTGGGNGGDGRNSTDGSGTSGSTPGGGGGGALRNGFTNYSGGNGANGQVIVTWVTPATEPTTQPSNVTFASVTSTGMTINWNNTGDGTNRIVLVKAGSAVDSDPVDGTTYTASTVFGSGSEIGTGNRVVYTGTGNSVSITGLSANTEYFVAVYEFNGSGGGQNYLTVSPATGSQLTALLLLWQQPVPMLPEPPLMQTGSYLREPQATDWTWLQTILLQIMLQDIPTWM